MPAKRKSFVCEVCGNESSSTVSNFYKQKKKYNISRCRNCASRSSTESVRSFYNGKITNTSTIEVKCHICGKSRIISYRQSKSGKPCASCSAKKSHENNPQSYKSTYIKRMGNKDFSESVKKGMSKVDSDKLIENARKGAKYWKDESKKSLVLSKRDTKEYRDKLRKIWQDDSFKQKMSTIASERLKSLWQDDDYRQRMAAIRSKQLINNRSAQHVHLCSLLEDLNIKYTNEYVIGPWTFDCFIKDMNILIEVQGDYWHSLPKAIRLDKSKSTYIKRYYPDYKIVYFYEHEFYQKDAVINRLKYELGKSKLSAVSFNFNEVRIEPIVADKINDFMYKYHYIGPSNHSTNIGFFHGDKLIACCSFSPVTRKESADRLNVKQHEIRELSRFCIHPNYQKKNFASWAISRALKWIKKNKKWNVIIAFSDTTIGHFGTIYKASNFTYDGTTGKSYYYISKTGYVMHKKTLYNRAIKMSMTEKEFASKYGYEKRNTIEKNRYLYYLVG